MVNCGNNTYAALGWNKIYLFDGNGDTIWTKNYAWSNATFYPIKLVKTSDGGFAYSGVFTPNVNVTNLIAFVKTDSLGNTVFTSIVDPENNFQPLTIYPNPATDKLYVNAGAMINEKKLVFTLTDMQGRSILNGRYDGAKAIDVSMLPGGIYIATLKGKEKEVRGKVIIQR